jgi:sialic acid synthase SpsE
VELALGDGYKHRTISETKNLAAARKSVFLKQSLREGDQVRPEMLVMLRPGDGISPMDMDTLVGKRLRHDLPIHHKLTWKDIQ